jgi:hypothetical protein
MLGRHRLEYEDQAEAGYPCSPDGSGPFMLSPKGFDDLFLFCGDVR